MPLPPPDPLRLLSERLAGAIREALGADLPEGANPALTPARDTRFGDFQCTIALTLAKPLGLPPRELAQRIVNHLRIDDLALEPTIAGPGFINIRLRSDALAAALVSIDNPSLGITPVPPPRPGAEPDRVVVDLCGVNLAKQMHVGHLRATVIGDALARLWARLGHPVIRQNHFGDWGLPIATVTAAVKDLVEAGRVSLDTLTLDDLEQLYRRAQRECEADETGLAAVLRFGLGPKAHAELDAQVAGARERQAAARRALVALQSHDPAHLAIWKEISRITLAACFDACARLHADVTHEATAGESTYADELEPLVNDLVSRGIAQEDDGALVIRLDEYGIKEPLLVRKRDGGFLYATTDLAGIRRRVQSLGAARVLYAVDARQSFHFKQVFAAAHRCGYTRRPDGAGDALLFHAAFGTVLGEDGKPFKTRSGDNIRLTDLLDEAVARAQRAVLAKNPDLPPEERRAIAKAVGIGAIKYADLASDRIRDYVFSFDRMLAFEGNTGPYLQYALVRVLSILRKAREQFGADESALDHPSANPGDRFRFDAPTEKTLALELLKYPGVIRAAAESCEPHRLCGYLFDLATAFNAFFAACPVLQAGDDALRLARLRLARLTGRVLRDGLTTLGIRPLERM